MKTIKIRQQKPILSVIAISLAGTLVMTILCGIFFYGHSATDTTNVLVDKDLLVQHLRILSSVSPVTDRNDLASLNRNARYILKEFRKTGCLTNVQRFIHDGKEYQNVVCSYGPEKEERVVVGAHYDVFGDQPGADDNASGVAGLLELSRLVQLMKPSLPYRLDFVAFTLEETQSLCSGYVGSHVYAQSLAQSEVAVRAMICLEMIGYFSNQPGSQKYPFFFMKWLYPEKGNYIAVVGKPQQNDLVERIQRHMSASSQVPVVSVAAPSIVPGIDSSDHQSFWHFKYKAVMVTDTAYYRNINYHKKTDTVDTLDIDKMAEVVKGLYGAIISL